MPSTTRTSWARARTLATCGDLHLSLAGSGETSPRIQSSFSPDFTRHRAGPGWRRGRRAHGRAIGASHVIGAPRGASPAEGPPGAPITIVAWSDHTCGFCFRAQHTLDALQRLYPGQLRLVHRFLPLDRDHTIAAEAALAAAAQGRFRPMNDRIYAVAGRVE